GYCSTRGAAKNAMVGNSFHYIRIVERFIRSDFPCIDWKAGPSVGCDVESGGKRPLDDPVRPSGIATGQMRQAAMQEIKRLRRRYRYDRIFLAGSEGPGQQSLVSGKFGDMRAIGAHRMNEVFRMQYLGVDDVVSLAAGLQPSALLLHPYTAVLAEPLAHFRLLDQQPQFARKVGHVAFLENKARMLVADHFGQG